MNTSLTPVTTIVVVEDESLVRAGLKELIEGEDDLVVVGEACDGIEALAVISEAEPDVVVMDVRMPGLDGTEVTRRLLAYPKPPAVLLLTTFGVEESLLDGLRAGASGFLLKSTTAEQFLDAIRVVAAGDSIVSPKLTRSLVQHVIARGAEPASELSKLSDRERDVLKLVARGLSNAEIAQNLELALPTVKSHIRHILAKLGLRSRLQAVLAAQTGGLSD
jgi:DNA-binding NarL/FixJ family response regulator